MPEAPPCQTWQMSGTTPPKDDAAGRTDEALLATGSQTPNRSRRRIQIGVRVVMLLALLVAGNALYAEQQLVAAIVAAIAAALAITGIVLDRR